MFIDVNNIIWAWSPRLGWTWKKIKITEKNLRWTWEKIKITEKDLATIKTQQKHIEHNVESESDVDKWDII
jgi:hypothetical protein